MAWINTISYERATGKLKKLYDRVKGPNNVIDNVLSIHSLRPHSLQGHMALYKNILHHRDNALPKWYLETIGTYVSSLNHCEYCVAHHSIGVKKNLPPDILFEDFIHAILSESFTTVLNPKQVSGMEYAKVLTLTPNRITPDEIKRLKDNGFDDGEILEINQVISYFNYVNRTVLGLGVNLEKDNIGLSPSSDDGDNWSHV